MTAGGGKVMVVIHAPGIDELRVRRADDRNYLVLTFREGGSSGSVPAAIAARRVIWPVSG